MKVFSIIVIIILLIVFIYITCPNLHLSNSVVPFYKQNGAKFPEITGIDTITIFLTSGLSNRIRTMLGFIHVCKHFHKKLNVIWIPDATCNGTFLDYFKPIDGVEFVKVDSTPIHYTGQSMLHKIVEHYNLQKSNDIYCYIQLRDELQIIVDNFVSTNKLTDCVGIHVRRTDYTGNFIGKILNGENSDEDFCDYINRYSKGKQFFMATDNKDTQTYYIKKYGKRTRFYESIHQTDDLRKTTLSNAIIDIYLLSYCKSIKGTYNSSFSEFSRSLKRSRKFLLN